MLTIILAIGIADQVIGTAVQYVIPWGKQMWEVRNRPPWERSGVFASWMGEDEIAYLRFLRAQVPEEAEVIVFQPDWIFRWMGNVQYFLFPRTIRFCEKPALADCYGAGTTRPAVVLIVRGVPAAEQIPAGLEVVHFPEDADFGYIRVR